MYRVLAKCQICLLIWNVVLSPKKEMKSKGITKEKGTHNKRKIEYRKMNGEKNGNKTKPEKMGEKRDQVRKKMVLCISMSPSF